MQKFLYFTDTHYGANPVNRKDDYNESILKKLRSVLNLAHKNNCIVLHGGDLFDSPKIGFFVFNKLISLLQEFKEKGVIIHTVNGNEGHDGHKENSPLSLLNSVGLVKVIYDYIDFDNVRVIGCGHGIDPVVAAMQFGSKKVASIMLTHLTLTKESVIFDHILWSEFRLPVDIVCVAHYHPYQGIEFIEDGEDDPIARELRKVASEAQREGGATGAGGPGTMGEGGAAGARNASNPLASPPPAPPLQKGRWFVAPGALARRKKTKHDIDRVPKCVYIQVEPGKQPRFKEIDIKCEKDIWTNNLKLEVDEMISSNIQVKEEIQNMKTIMDDTIMFASNIEDVLKVFAMKNNYKEEVIDYVIKQMRAI